MHPPSMHTKKLHLLAMKIFFIIVKVQKSKQFFNLRVKVSSSLPPFNIYKLRPCLSYCCLRDMLNMCISALQTPHILMQKISSFDIFFKVKLWVKTIIQKF